MHLNVGTRAGLFAKSDYGEFINPEKPFESLLWDAVKSNRMPQGLVKLNREELETIEKWLTAGAPYPEDVARKPLSELDVCQAILADLISVPDAQQPNTRYVSFVHLHNDPQIKPWELRLHRAALSKLVNSLSQNRQIRLPVAVANTFESVYRIDLKDYEWDATDWLELLKTYPYGLNYTNADVSDMQNKIRRQFGIRSRNPVAYVRGDWLIAKATLPEMYHKLLDLPDDLEGLEKRLGVNINDNIKKAQVGANGRTIARAGFSESGVSVANRLVERHETQNGALWVSYDFGTSSGIKNLFLHPLGPKFKDNPFNDDFAFEQDGGEMVFNLPNGLQGYFLVNKDGKRIDRGPISVVRDKDEVSGTPEVVNGLSCLSCHNRGMKRFADAVAEGFPGGGQQERDKVRALYLPKQRMNQLLDEDTERFEKAVKRATGPFLLVDEDKNKDVLADFDEPIKKVVQRYNQDLTVQQAAVELGLLDQSDAGRLQFQIKNSRNLKELGIGAFAVGRTIKREIWESKRVNVTLFQDTAQSLDIGGPLNFN